MSVREIYLLLHILSAMVWMGGSVMTQIFGARAQRSGDTARRLVFAKDAAIAGRVLTIAGVSAAVWGVLLVIEIDLYEWEQAWIGVGIFGVLVGALLGARFYAPQTRKLISQLEAGAAEAAATLKRIVLVSRIEIVVLAVVLWAMVTKPGL
jgi:uncharacterized membrane protein